MLYWYFYETYTQIKIFLSPEKKIGVKKIHKIILDNRIF